MLVHVIDCATMEPGRDPISDIDALEAELAAYQPSLQGDSALGDLADRPRAVVLNKIDIPDAKELAEFVRPDIEERGWPVVFGNAPPKSGGSSLPKTGNASSGSSWRMSFACAIPNLKPPSDSSRRRCRRRPVKSRSARNLPRRATERFASARH